MTLPGGTVTFLFLDIEGSTGLLERIGTDYPQLLATYREITEQAVDRHGGAIFGSEGDGLFAAFAEAGEAVRSAIETQQAFDSADWPDRAAVKVRMGIHTGAPTLIGDDYTGIDVHRAARIMSAAWGGQVLISETTRSLISDTAVKCRELGLYAMKGLSRNERLYQLEGPGLPGDFPPVRARRREVDLPIPATALIGRDDDISTVVRLIEEGARLVTLTGPGGIGKSRLAVAVAASLAAHFTDGVGYVDLSNEVDTERVAKTMAEQLGVAADPSHSMLDALIDHHAALEALLVLDGFERVTGAAVGIAELLAGCADLRILVTSRAALRIGAEREIRVDPSGAGARTRRLRRDRGVSSSPSLHRASTSGAPRPRAEPVQRRRGPRSRCPNGGVPTVHRTSRCPCEIVAARSDPEEFGWSPRSRHYLARPSYSPTEPQGHHRMESRTSL